MFEKQLNEVEVAFEKIRYVIDQEEWRSALMAVNTSAQPYLPWVAVNAHYGINPNMPVAPSMLKTAQELSLLLKFIPTESRPAYAFAMAIYALTHTIIGEQNSEQRKEG